MTTVPTTSTQKRRIRTSLRKWKGTFGDTDRELFQAFVEQTLNRLRGPFLAQHHPTDVLHYLEVAFNFAKQRSVDTHKVSIQEGPSKGILTVVNMADQPFIVDTIRLFLKVNRADYWSGFNLVFPATRDASGTLIAIDEADGNMESLVLIESDFGDIQGNTSGKIEELSTNIEMAKAMVQDFRSMTRTVERTQERLIEHADQQPQHRAGLFETAEFLKWLLRENFVFMGLEVLSDGENTKAFGIQKIKSPFFGKSDGDWPPPHEPGTIRVRKCEVESPVHRSGRIDEILVQLPSFMGGDSVFIRGMFTYRAVNQPCRNVPILRRVLATILENQEAKPGSFRHKGIANVFDSLPTEFLFTAEQGAISEMVDLVFESEQQQEVGVTLMMIGNDSAFCLVAMPKTQFSDELREALQEHIKKSTRASYVDHGLFVGRYDTVLLHFFVTGIRKQSEATFTKLSEDIRSLATPWFARLWHELTQSFDEDVADRLADTYGHAFPSAWKRATSAKQTVQDIIHLESLSGRGFPKSAVHEVNGKLHLRLYQPKDVYLSHILPIMDDFGLVIIDSYATEVKSRGSTLHIDTLNLQGTKSGDLSVLKENSDVLVEAVNAVFAGKITSDALNQLVISAKMTWKEVDVFRAYIGYMRQIMANIAPSLTQEIVLGRPDLMKELTTLFKARFDPDLKGDRKKAIAACEDSIEGHLRRILTHDEDLVFSTLYDLLCNTLRTNCYRTDLKDHYLSFKLDIPNISELEGARHFREIYVHHKSVEGVHIRFGPVSRGGLRWSDRLDYRTEVLGLATTQQKKNVVIVPEGSKGGFYLRNPSSDPMERRKEADTLYQTFIRGLLDLTDNVVDGQEVAPPRTVCHDEFDPYLVVAADKGTAHLSDTANAISQGQNFWLGDAFASGGSNGYDHKAVGITARGAWVLVRRHFAEMGRDPYSEAFTCVGVGDCGGDVFGNGMTESPHTRLLAAFNHIHIFLDPNPDEQSSYAERLRLFKSGGRNGGWNNYKTELISSGGGVFDRTAKTIPLSPECQEMLGIFEAEVDPHLVIQAILKMKVDLLWNGGIGTYVRHSTENDSDADDRANDAVRINALELAAEVIGEGGNLGFTQNARIEADQNGVRLNTDAIDNSAGVDMSDHEVNLKILLDRVVERGELSLKQRNQLLAKMTDEVAVLVMQNNDAHGRQISRDRVRSAKDIFQFGRAIAFVERTFGVQRHELGLPQHDELRRRAEEGEGLTRPELAVLGAWVKMYVYQQLMAGSPKETPGYSEMLHEYFPKDIQNTYPEDITQHMLCDEIAMTVATTRVVADAGASFIPIMIETTGTTVPTIVTALIKAQQLARVDEVRSTLEELRTSVSLGTLTRGWVEVQEGARMVVLYWLSANGRIPTDEELESMLPAVDEVFKLESERDKALVNAAIEEMKRDRIPTRIAAHILKAKYLNFAVMNWAEARRTGTDIESTIAKNVAVSRASGLWEIIEGLVGRSATGQWEPIALQILYIRYLQLLRKVLVQVEIKTADKTVGELQKVLEMSHLADVRHQVEDLLAGEKDHPDTATLLVLEERLANAVSRMDIAT